MSIAEYSCINDSNYFCNRCGSKKMKRTFVAVYSDIQKDKESFIDDIRNDVLKTVEKINSGDISAITDIYGEELNKLKC